MIQRLRTSISQSAAPLVKLLAVFVVLASFQVPAANAAMVGTETVVISQAERVKVAEFLQRDDVQKAFEQQGVDATAALARVDRLTDAEVATLAEHIDQMPAGGDIVGAALLVFFVLLITDLLGLTHVFPFVNR